MKAGSPWDKNLRRAPHGSFCLMKSERRANRKKYLL
jgi:hypothetical protein